MSDELCYAFSNCFLPISFSSGDLSHFNIWNFILPPKEVTYLASSCTFQYCGNAVQWVEFRAGTRGAIRMRWPSGIFSEWPTCTSLGGVKRFVNYAISVSFKRSIWILQCGQYEHTTKVELVRWLIVTDSEWRFWHELLNDVFATIALGSFPLRPTS